MTEAATVENDAALRDLVQEIVARADPAAVYLFGSRARGDHYPDSDYDIPIVVDDHRPVGGTQVDAAYALVRGRRMPVDAFVTRESVFRAERGRVNTMSNEVMLEGRSLYERGRSNAVA